MTIKLLEELKWYFRKNTTNKNKAGKEGKKLQNRWSK